ncbi:MAG: LysM peptidoglycan-binding domain-containing protein [Mobilitalea sp.]
MIIHIVQSGETIESIANSYGISTSRLIIDNDLYNFNQLVLGQTIVIAIPEKTYVVAEGDTIQSIAEQNGISIRELLQNNNFLYNRDYIFPGETLVISYGTFSNSVNTNGYAYPFIDFNVLKRTLPYLTFISIFGYLIKADGSIESVADYDLLNISRLYQVAPILLLSAQNIQGNIDLEVAFRVLYDEDVQENLLNNIFDILKSKNYSGVNITYQFINMDNIEYYNNLTIKLYARLHYAGYLVYITLPHNKVIIDREVTFERFDYSVIGRYSDGITIMNYNWGYSYGPPAPVSSITDLKEVLNYVLTQVPPEKIDLGIPIIGYDWELPYIIGVTKARSLTIISAVNLASEFQAVILFDEASQTPYFEYIDTRDGIPIRHIVWFVDARSINSLMNLVDEYMLKGSGIWNIMYFYAQMWLVINSQNEIATLEPEINT